MSATSWRCWYLTRSKKQSEPGCGRLFSTWKNSRRLFEGINTSSRPEAAKRSEERPSTGSTIRSVQNRRVRLHWTCGRKFFRFRAHPVLANGSNSTVDAPRGIRRARHYWFCERCSHVFALVYEKEYGVMLKLLWPELPIAAHKELSAAQRVWRFAAVARMNAPSHSLP